MCLHLNEKARKGKRDTVREGEGEEYKAELRGPGRLPSRDT